MSIKNALKYGAYAIGGLLAFVLLLSLFSRNDIVASSVMITNLNQNSGGSGVVMWSSEAYSTVLTNAHVCNVVKNGGIVSNNDGEHYLVYAYKPSTTQDLCLIKVLGNLHARTKLANGPPEYYYEKASISGHPHLMPTVVTTGHFSGKSTIQVMTGLRPCTDEDTKDLGSALVCFILGGMPIFKDYDSVLVTATIMPGSSGSGVFNKHNELCGLVFAGSGDLGYAWTVPYENVAAFLNQEINTIQEQLPSNSLEADKGSHTQTEAFKRWVCNFPSHRPKICDTLDQDMIWHR